MTCLRNLLAAALLGGSSAVSAAPTVYGLSFIGTGLSAERPDQELAALVRKDFTGTFTFDPETNQLLFLDAEFTGPGRDFTSGAVSLFNAAQPCDLNCFVGSLQNGSFRYSYANGGASLYLGSPLSGTTSVSAVAFSSRPFDVTGRIQFNGAVPEPGTWVMMLVGFGAIGVSMRRRVRSRLSYSLSS